MPLLPGTRLGSYEITGTIGAGGMGEVYRARDTRLDRDVALKILPESFASDSDRLMRFEREARTLASLNHPHIAQIYGVVDLPPEGGSHEGGRHEGGRHEGGRHAVGSHALVMELVEGEDLAQRIARGAIPLDDSLAIAKQVAEALEAAHDSGIIHRDLKPANIKIRPDGTVKVLDFGLAKVTVEAGFSRPSSDAPPPTPSASPTFTSPALTQMGMILGTAAYMAPEQAKGRLLDRGADLWAFGVVLYEMLTGQRAFPGDDITDTLATVLKSDPDWQKLPSETPPAIRRLLRRCLEKDPRLRLRDAGSAVLEIREAPSGDAQHVTPIAAGGATTRRTRVPIVLAGLAIVAVMAATGFVAWTALRPVGDAPVVHRLVVAIASSDTLPRAAGNVLAISPDGRTLAYTVLRNRRRVILRRSLDGFDATPIAGTEEGRDPFFSPDGLWVGFTSDNVLKKVPVSGGAPVTIAALPSGIRGADWQADGRIILGQNGPTGLLEVPATGGAITTLFNPEEGRLWYPQALQDGRTILFTYIPRPRADPVISGAGRATAELRLFDRTSGEVRPLVENASSGRVLPDGYLVFVRDDALWAVSFDLDRLQVRGTPVPLVQGVRVESGRATQAVVANGTLVYLSGGSRAGLQKRLMWVGRNEQQDKLRPPPRDYIGLRLSPDGSRAAVQVVDSDSSDVWVTELALGTLTRISNTGSAEHPVWSRDGRHIVFSSEVEGQVRLLRRASDGTGVSEVIATFDKSIRRAQPTVWLSDGSLLVELQTRADEGDIGVLPRSGDWRPVVRTPRFEGQSALSPDGRWLAYASDESGETQVYVQPFPGPGSRQQVPGPGWAPTWSRHGKELLYLRGGPPTDVMRVDVSADAGQGRLVIGAPEPIAAYLFYDRRTAARFYDAPASGERILFISRSDEVTDDDRDIRVVVNWIEELRQALTKP